jgi:hypothetical protein
MHLTHPARDTVLLLVRDRTFPPGRLAVIAEKAGQQARSWLEGQAP